MALRDNSANAEPETLRIHREMYERRLREMELSGSSRGKDEVEATSPSILDGSGDERATKKAASI